LLKPENAITAGSCISFSYLYFCGVGLRQVEVLITWNNTGFFRYLVILWCE